MHRGINRTLLARLWCAGEGVTAVETALLLPVFLLFLLGICEFGRMLWTQSALQYAAEAAARCAVVSSAGTCNSTSATQTYAAGKVIGMTIPSSTFTVTGSCSGTITVTASYDFDFIVPQLFPWEPTMTAKSAYPC